MLTKRIAASGNEIDTTIPIVRGIVRANELKDGWRRRERNLRSNQAKSPASKFILLYIALFCPRRIFSPGRHCYSLKETNTIYSRELFSYLFVKSAYIKEMQRKRQTKFMRYPTKWNWSKRKQIYYQASLYVFSGTKITRHFQGLQNSFQRIEYENWYKLYQIRVFIWHRRSENSLFTTQHSPVNVRCLIIFIET